MFNPIWIVQYNIISYNVLTFKNKQIVYHIYTLHNKAFILLFVFNDKNKTKIYRYVPKIMNSNKNLSCKKNAAPVDICRPNDR